MSRNLVKCPWQNFVEIPSAASVSVGEDCLCPSSCPNRNKRQAPCSYGWFTAKSASAPKDDATDRVYAYSAEEITKQFPKLTIESARVDAPAPTPTPASFSAPAPSVASTAERPAPKDYSFDLFGGGRASVGAPPVAPEAPKARADSVLKPARSYDEFELRGVYYTLRERGNTCCLTDSTQLKRFFRRILETFDLSSVMDGQNFKDNFLWVLDNTLVGEQRSRAAEVLNAEVTSSAERFFLLFYYAIFHNQQLPLYWASGYTRELQPIYRDTAHFYTKIASGKDRFYEEQSGATLLWLRKITLSEWRNEDKKRECLQEIQVQVAVESPDDIVFFWESRLAFVGLGKKEAFVRDLLVSDKSIKTLEETAVFLSRFDILPSGSGYRVSRRAAPDDEYGKSIAPEEINDDIMGKLFSYERSRNKAELYLYIVSRYCQLFRPSAVTVGGVTYTKARYTEQIEQAVDEFFAYFLGDAATDVQRRAAHTEALLAKLLYEKDVLFESARDEEYMKRLLANISADALKEESAAKAYFAFCRACGRDDKITLYAYDYTSLPRKAKLMGLLDFMKQRIGGASGTASLSALLKTPVFAAYKEAFCGGGSGFTEIEAYRAIERNAMKIVETL